MKKIAAISLAMVLALWFNACKKEESGTLSATEEERAATVAAISETETEFTFNDVFDNVLGVNSELGIAGVGIFGKIISGGRLAQPDSISRCFKVTITPLQPGVFPKTVVIDFGSGCSSHYQTRSGKIITVYTGKLTLPGSSATTTFEQYKINNISVEGSHVIKNITQPGSNQRQFEVKITDARLTRPDGDYVVWNSHRIEKQIEGNATTLHQDDIFSITGAAKGKVKDGNYIFLWNSEITEPLIKSFSCRWITKGRIRVVRETLTSNSPWVSILDYGNGFCDNKASLTINGTTRQISLH